MKISSKSILSPGRTDKQISLSASLSRRLRTNRSIKGGQSPMFSTGSKKKGSGFENTEPTSPKVTCIGQVRVKTKKKQAMKMRSMSKRIGSSGESSFRRIEDHNHHHHHQHSGFLQQQEQRNQNQKWVHLPMTICEALRAFGAEFNCFLPCRSSCLLSSTEQKEREKMNGSLMEERKSSRSCGALFARWLVAYQEREGRSRKIELVVQKEEEEPERRRSYHRRRHVMDAIDVNEVEKLNVEKIGVVEEGRVSICVPPKNALLLMRCRSDPVKVAALANKFWESPARSKDNGDDEIINLHGYEQEEQFVEEVKDFIEKDETLEIVLETVHEEDDIVVSANISILLMEVGDQDETNGSFQEIKRPEEEIAESQEENDDEESIGISSQETLFDPEIDENEELKPELIQENNDELRRESSQYYVSPLSEKEEECHKIEAGTTMVNTLEEEKEELTVETVTNLKSEPELHENSVKEEEEEPELERESRTTTLPDSLLLMMYEPKLSMEVSKETWVCSTDFIRCIPSSERRKVNKSNGKYEPKKKVSIDSNPALATHSLHLKPPRSSCSFPTAVAAAAAGHGLSIAAMIEQKLGNSVAYEPFVLTRCKSAPIKTSAKVSQPDVCYWNNRKLEHHRGTALGVGAAGF